MNASDNSKQKQTEIAKRLAALHPGLEINQVGAYTSLRVGPGQLTNCVVVSRTGESASFLMADSKLHHAVQEAELEVKPITPTKAKAFEGFQYRVFGVSVLAIERNQELFKRLVDESVRFVKDRRKGSVNG